MLENLVYLLACSELRAYKANVVIGGRDKLTHREIYCFAASEKRTRRRVRNLAKMRACKGFAWRIQRLRMLGPVIVHGFPALRSLPHFHADLTSSTTASTIARTPEHTAAAYEANRFP